MILIPILLPVAPAVATGMTALDDQSVEHEKCINKTGHNHSSVDGQLAVGNGTGKATDSEHQYSKDSCCHRGEYSCQGSYLGETSTTPVLLARTSILSQHEVAISFFSFTEHFFTNEDYQPPLRPPIY